jgi:hypothetical protein
MARRFKSDDLFKLSDFAPKTTADGPGFDPSEFEFAKFKKFAGGKGGVVNVTYMGRDIVFRVPQMVAPYGVCQGMKNAEVKKEDDSIKLTLDAPARDPKLKDMHVAFKTFDELVSKYVKAHAEKIYGPAGLGLDDKKLAATLKNAENDTLDIKECVKGKTTGKAKINLSLKTQQGKVVTDIKMKGTNERISWQDVPPGSDVDALVSFEGIFFNDSMSTPQLKTPQFVVTPNTDPTGDDDPFGDLCAPEAAAEAEDASEDDKPANNDAVPASPASPDDTVPDDAVPDDAVEGDKENVDAVPPPAPRKPTKKRSRDDDAGLFV